jgi:serine/threonine-protein kinase
MLGDKVTSKDRPHSTGPPSHLARPIKKTLRAPVAEAEVTRRSMLDSTDDYPARDGARPARKTARQAPPVAAARSTALPTAAADGQDGASVGRDGRVLERDRFGLPMEARDLLCARLGAATQWLALSLGLLLARHYVLFDGDRAMLLVHAWVVIALGIVHVWLANDRGLTLRQLRAVELVVFGLTAALLATSQYRQTLLCRDPGDLRLLSEVVKSHVLGTLILLLTYGIFIPNDWRRAAAVVTPMAVLPLVVAWLVALGDPELMAAAARAGAIGEWSDSVLMLLLGAVLAVLGTQVVGALCARVFQAHHLGPYHLRERISTGGMGEVYLAEHQLLKRPCAIKLIRPSSAADPRALARFEREVRTTAQLSHWNTVEVYDYGRTEDGTFYYVMEYLPGLSLAELVERHGPLPAERVIHLLRQACQALREAHGLGMVHRDIKPANIFAAERGGLHDVTKLLDFGLAKRKVEPPATQLSYHGMITGSPLYMSPEQASGLRADHRSDIYALGAVAYYLLTGNAPFRGENALSVMIAHARDAAPPPSAFRDDIPADLERVVLRCLAKDPAGRYPDAASLEQALAACSKANLWTEDRAAAWWRTAAAPASPATAGTSTMASATAGFQGIAAAERLGYVH